jgi:hypothetical protein
MMEHIITSCRAEVHRRVKMIPSHKWLGGYVESDDMYLNGERLAIIVNHGTQGQKALRIQPGKCRFATFRWRLYLM